MKKYISPLLAALVVAGCGGGERAPTPTTETQAPPEVGEADTGDRFNNAFYRVMTVARFARRDGRVADCAEALQAVEEYVAAHRAIGLPQDDLPEDVADIRAVCNRESGE